MVASTTEMSRYLIFVHRFDYLETQIFHQHDNHFCSSSELCSGDQRRRLQRKFLRRQVCVRNGCSLPLSRHTYYLLHRLDDRSHSEVSYILSHTFAQSLKSDLQEGLQVLSYMMLDSRGFYEVSEIDARTEEGIGNHETGYSNEHVSVPFSRRVQRYPCRNFDISRVESPFRRLHFSLLSPQSNFRLIMRDLSYRGLSGVSNGKKETVEEKEQTWDNGGDESENESGESQTDGGKSVADVKEVESVYKLIEELFASDRNTEAVPGQRGIDLSHNLVLDVLAWFRHVWAQAFWFFWVGRRSGFLHHSRTCNSVMVILGKTKQFENLVMLLEEMRNKELLTTEIFSLAIRAIAAAREVKAAVWIFELMRRRDFRVAVGTLNCLLDGLSRAKHGKEAQALLEKTDRSPPDLQTNSLLPLLDDAN